VLTAEQRRLQLEAERQHAENIKLDRLITDDNIDIFVPGYGTLAESLLTESRQYEWVEETAEAALSTFKNSQKSNADKFAFVESVYRAFDMERNQLCSILEKSMYSTSAQRQSLLTSMEYYKIPEAKYQRAKVALLEIAELLKNFQVTANPYRMVGKDYPNILQTKRDLFLAKYAAFEEAYNKLDNRIKSNSTKK
jgi:hemoglobin-like flavoprotein